ncbi:MAG: hypothetical protein R3B48_07300 [Kofleriaceae bacterium]
MGARTSSGSSEPAARAQAAEELGDEPAGGARTAAGDEPAGILPCDGATPGVPRLEGYEGVRIPGTYWVDLVFNGVEWSPATYLRMPHHHATRLELTNVLAFPSLLARQTERVRFVVEITSREIRQVLDRREWRATYYARIVDVCVPAQR